MDSNICNTAIFVSEGPPTHVDRQMAAEGAVQNSRLLATMMQTTTNRFPGAVVVLFTPNLK